MVNPLGRDVGWAGSFVPMVVGESTLLELRDLAGPPPVPGQSWVLVDLKTGEFKWYQSRTRTNRGRRSRRY